MKSAGTAAATRSRRREPIEDFIATLSAEIDLVASELGGGRVTELHWGGGTPNILEPAAFARLFQALSARFDFSELAHHAIEIDPRCLDADTARAYKSAGVTRASLGVQDLNEHVQRAIGRIQPLELVQRAVTILRAHGVDDLSIDLMYGLPAQRLEDLASTVQQVVALAPARIALFGYAHVPWFKKRQRMIDETLLPTAAARFEQAAAARTALEAAGYSAIGLDHFALPEDELAIAATEQRLRRSFQGYVAEGPGAIVGLGPSAISTLPQGYAQNAAEPGAWARAIASGALATARGHALSEEDRIRRRLIEQIMCDFVADLGPLGGREGCASALETLAPMIALGLVRVVDDAIVLSAEARPLCRLVGMAFDAYARPEGRQRHAAAI